jgi:hypothetical protein
MLAGLNRHAGAHAPALTGAVSVNTPDVEARWGRFREQVRGGSPMASCAYGRREVGRDDHLGSRLQCGQALTTSAAKNREQGTRLCSEQPAGADAVTRAAQPGRVCRACGHAWGWKSPVQVCVEPKDQGSARASPRGGV